MSLFVNPSVPFGHQQASLEPRKTTLAEAPGNAKDTTRDRLNNLLIQWQGYSSQRAIARAEILQSYDDRSIPLELSDKIRKSLPKEVGDLFGEKENRLYPIEE